MLPTEGRLNARLLCRSYRLHVAYCRQAGGPVVMPVLPATCCLLKAGWRPACYAGFTGYMLPTVGKLEARLLCRSYRLHVAYCRQAGGPLVMPVLPATCCLLKASWRPACYAGLTGYMLPTVGRLEARLLCRSYRLHVAYCSQAGGPLVMPVLPATCCLL